MQKQAPTAGRLMVMAVFALSCFALLLYLWTAFGGSIPLAPKGYRFTASFAEATQLADEAEVRISGVPVGRVKHIEAQEDGRSAATIQLDARYAPIPLNTRAILRQKSLLGETYVELSPGDRSSGMLHDGATLAVAQVAPTVELDEIFRAFDPKTREAFRTWFQAQEGALHGRGRDLNDALGNLPAFAEDTDVLLQALRAQQSEVRGVVRDTGTVVDALTARDGELGDLIANSDRVFSATAERNQDLKDLVHALPTFQRESTQTVERLTGFARTTDPLITRLHPAARELSPTLEQLAAAAPDLKGLLGDLIPLEQASRAGAPATDDFLARFSPVLGELDAPIRQLNPILRYIGAYRDELRAFILNVTAITEATDRPPHAKDPVHYARGMSSLNPESLAAYPRRIGSHRSQPYPLPGATLDLGKGGIPSFETRDCGKGDPALAPSAAGLPLTAGILRYTFGYAPGQTSGTVAAPACRQQARGFPHLSADPQP